MSKVDDSAARRKRRSLLPLAVVFAIVVVVVAGALIAAFDDGGDDGIEAAGPFADVVTPRALPAQSVAGDLFWVFGGVAIPKERDQFVLRNDGALVDPDHPSIAEPLPSSPFDPPLYAPRAVGTQASVVVVGTSCTVTGISGNESDPLCDPGWFAAASFDVASRGWQRIEMPAELDRRLGYAWGLGVTPRDEAIFAFAPADPEGAGTEAQESVWRPQYWMYSPRESLWARLPDSGVRSEESCVAGDHLVALTSPYGSGNGSVEVALRLLPLSAPDKGWSAIPIAANDYSGSSAQRIECMEEHVMAMNRSGQGQFRMYDIAGGRWSIPPPAPQQSDSGSVEFPFFTHAVWTGRELVFMPDKSVTWVGKSGQAFDPDSRIWRVLPDAPLVGPEGVVWTGNAIVGYDREPLADPDSAFPPGQPRVIRFVP